MNVNSVTLQGTLERESQSRENEQGTLEVRNQVRIVGYWNGTQKQTYVPISAFGRVGDSLNNTVKGADVMINGKLAWRKDEQDQKWSMYVRVTMIDVEECRPQAVEADNAPAHGDEDLPF